ncbi:hypothetical protein AB3662_27120 [Sorangium cellulosum]|uniref:hypothetical protein n=1 Tax=Sorangium cellulosum TaxID=56 RepID=UPI003D9A391F
MVSPADRAGPPSRPSSAPPGNPSAPLPPTLESPPSASLGLAAVAALATVGRLDLAVAHGHPACSATRSMLG